MARYSDRIDDDRDLYAREERSERGPGWEYDDSYRRRRNIEEERRLDHRLGRFGERAAYEYDEPRYSERREPLRDGRVGDSLAPNRESWRRQAREYYGPARSRLRCRDIMTRDLAVATRDTTLREVAIMMKQEDTGVIPVVDHEVNGGGNGKTTTDDRKYETRGYGRGKLAGLITDRDLAIRAVAEDKDCAVTHAESIMTSDIHSARPNDRVVDVLRTMGNKQVRRIPVVGEDNRLLGMISMADIAVETEADQELAEAIEEISKQSSIWRRMFG